MSDRAWNSTGGSYNSNNWSRPATLNTYLNGEYYEGLDSSIKDYIVSHTWGIGEVEYDNDDLVAQIVGEQGTTWSGNIGLISVSDYLRANSNTEQCENLSRNNTKNSTCRTTNWMFANYSYWTISRSVKSQYGTFGIFIMNLTGTVGSFGSTISTIAPRPAAYLKSDITLSGSGTSLNPFKIVL